MRRSQIRLSKESCIRGGNQSWDKSKKSLRVFGRDLKNILHHPTKQSAAAKKRDGVVRSTSFYGFPNKVSFVQQSHPHPRERESPKCPEEQCIEAITHYLRDRDPKASSEIGQCYPISLRMRKLVITWTLQLCHRLHLRAQTLFLCVHLFDKTLQGGRGKGKEELELGVDNLQLLSIVCLLISSKYQQINPPNINILLEMTDFTYMKRKVIEFESIVLRHHDFSLTCPTRFTYLSNELLKLTGNNKRTQQEKKIYSLAQYLCELTLLELWSDCTEGQIAEAVIFLTCKVLGIPICGERFSKCVYQLGWNLVRAWKLNHGKILSFIFDCDQYAFVGGISLEDH